MQNMFHNCSSLSSLDLSAFNTEKTLSIGSMFSGCSGLTSLDLSAFDASSLLDWGDAFYGTSVKELDLSWISENPQLVSGYSSNEVFASNDKLEKVYAVPDADFSGVAAGNRTFNGCIALSGGAGTQYNVAATSAAMARVDGLDGSTGYFTAKSYKDNDMVNRGTWEDEPIQPAPVMVTVDKVNVIDFGNGITLPAKIGDGEFTFELRRDTVDGEVVASASTPLS